MHAYLDHLVANAKGFRGRVSMIDITPDVVSVVDRASIICGGTVSAAMSGHDFRMSPGDGLCLIGSGHW